MKWQDLEPEPIMVKALHYAGDRLESYNQDQKRRWSERFANYCAIAFSERLRLSPPIRGKIIRPRSIEEGTEPLTPLGTGTSKRIDVTVVDSMLGLEIGISLKGLNFRDNRGNNFSKNLTGRLYELGDEVRLVHEYLPKTFMVGIFFLPLLATEDKTERTPSSFAQTVLKLRERTGRLDASLLAHSARCDAGYVALYTMGNERDIKGEGVVRFFDVRHPPPKRGRPLIGATMSLQQTVDAIVGAATFAEAVEWGSAEEH